MRYALSRFFAAYGQCEFIHRDWQALIQNVLQKRLDVDK